MVVGSALDEGVDVVCSNRPLIEEETGDIPSNIAVDRER
jgi:hypothetical protein